MGVRPVIDCHVHVYPPDVIENAASIGEREPYFALLSGGKVHRWATTEDVVSAMDRDGVETSWIFGFAFNDPGLCAHCNDYVIDSVRKYPGRLKGFAVVPPLSQGAEKEIFRCREYGLVGVGELFPGGQGFDISDERQTRTLAGAASEAGMILLIHTAEPVGHDYPGKGSTGPREAAEFCAHHPEVNVVFAHFGGGLWMYELMPEMRKTLANAYYDTAAWPWLYDPKLMTAIASAGVSHKILYGSDFPILSFSKYEKMLTASGLSEDDKARVLHGNAKSLLPD
jgi:hypothetical protein